MKWRNYFVALAVALFAAGAVSCSDDDEGDPTPDPDPDPVEECMTAYFPSDNVVAYEFSEDGELASMTFPVKVARVVTEKEASVPVSVTDGAAAFDVPATVAFAAGSASAEFTVALKEAVAGTYTLALALTGDDVDPDADVDGAPTLTVTVVVKEGEDGGDEEEWETFEGTALAYASQVSVSCTIKHLVGTDRWWFSRLAEGGTPFEVIVDWTQQDDYGYYLQFVESDNLVYFADYGGYDYYNEAGDVTHFIYLSDDSGYGSSVSENDSTEAGLQFSFSVYDYSIGEEGDYDWVFIKSK